MRRKEDGKLAVGERTRVSFLLYEDNTTDEVRVYPNRFDQEFFVETQQPMDQYQVQLRCGHYVLQISSPQGTHTRRVIKE